MTKREFLIKWKVDKEVDIKLHYVGKANLVLKHEHEDIYDEEKFDFVRDDIDNYIELLNDYKNIEWDNN
ncbi:hypothetical protein [Spiroplasma endosymbiont of Colias croceus]|uniref:hypothetical protein n=1 Tax=Spiroplasma endosymbiont of Colias croceus TaxID=3066310 RepID=UPI0030D47AAA